MHQTKDHQISVIQACFGVCSLYPNQRFLSGIKNRPSVAKPTQYTNTFSQQNIDGGEWEFWLMAKLKSNADDAIKFIIDFPVTVTPVRIALKMR